ncbi:alpha-like surface protein [Streptococcus agalactiae]
MFRRSKNNSYDTSQTKQRFSIKKFKFGAASVLIGLSFLGGVTQGNLNIFEESIVAASTIPGSAATLNTSITKNIQNGNAYIDLYDVKNGLIDPQNLIVLNPSSYSANYYIKQGGKYYSNPSEITTTGSATITFNILDETGNPHKKADGQIDIVSVNLTIYDSTALRNRIDEVINNANDPKWSDGSRDEVLTGLEKIKKDIDNNPKTQIDIDNKINEVNEIEKLLVVSLPDKIKYSPEAKHRTVEQHAELDAKDSIANTDELPSNSTYNWKNGHKPDTSTSGEKDGIVEVHYPDGTVDDVNVKVTVTSKKTDNTAPTLTVTPEQQTVKVDEDITFTVTAEDENEVELGLDDLKAKYENDIIGARVKIKYLTKEPNKKVMEVTIMKATLADKGAITFTAKDKAGNQAEPKTVTINVLPPDKIKYSPEAKHRTVEQHAELDAKDSIANTDELPSNSTYNWKNGHKPDTSTSGEKDGIVEVHYPDGTVDDVNVKVTVTSKKTDNTAPTLTVTPEQQTVKVDEDITFTVTAEDENEVELGLDDLKAKYENDIIGARVKIKYLTKEPNKKVMEVTIMKATLADKGAITFTAKDKAGNQAEPKTVTINVLPPDKIKYSPEAKHRTVEQHAELDAKDSIANTDELPSNSTYNWKNGHKPDTSTSGEKDGIVEVHYPDGTVDDVNVKVTVTSKKTDNTAPTLTVTPEQQTVKVDEDITFTVTAEDENEVELGLDDLKAKYENDIIGARVKIKYLTKEPNKKVMEVTIMKATLADKGAITFTAKDKAGNQAEPKTVTINVLPPDKIKYSPEAKHRTVEQHAELDAKDSIANTDELPSNSTYNWKNGHKPDTSTPGEKNAVVVVTYPDKSTDEVPVKVTVVDPRTDAEKNDPAGKDQTVKVGEQPDPTKSLEAVPAGSTVAYKEPVDTKTPGEKNAIVVVTYPDKSTDEVPVKVTVVDPRTDAEKNDPAGKDQTVKVGEQPDPTKSLEAVPAGSTVAYKEPVDTKTPGEKNAIVVVTYPDKSTDEVPVKVTVVDPRTDAEKNDPAGKDQTVKVGEQPDPTKSLEAVPAGSTVAYKEPVDTKTPGEKNAVVVVTYPDKSTDEVPVKVTVVDPRTDAEKNDPAGKDQTVKVGEQPDPTKSLEAVPAGSTVAYKEPVDTKTPGEKNAVVVVTYPDKSTDEVPVKVTVVDPRTDAEKNDPAGGETTVPQGTPISDEEITGLVKIPEGSNGVPKVVGDRPNTDVPGDYKVTVEVTYPDGTKDTVAVTVHVTPKPVPDKDKYDPTGKSQQVNGKGNKLPATGESATPFFNVAALTIISSVGLLSVSKKKED